MDIYNPTDSNSCLVTAKFYSYLCQYFLDQQHFILISLFLKTTPAKSSFIFCLNLAYNITMGSWYSGRTCRLVGVFVMTALFFLVELTVGYITNSMALVADSFHMLSDVLALFIAYLSVRVSRVSSKLSNFLLFNLILGP